MKSKLLTRLKLITFLLALGQFAMAQQRTIKGVVTNGVSKELIPGASVVVKGTTIGTTTDAYGAFLLDVPKDAAALTISFVGFTKQTVSIANGATLISVALLEGNT